MRVLLALDKFKDALAAREACRVAREAVEAILPGASVVEVPLTDGGEGFCEILVEAVAGCLEETEARGPMGEPGLTRLGFVPSSSLPVAVREEADLPKGGEIAIAEMASVAGLQALSPEERDPWRTSTHGVGDLLLRAATRKGTSAILLGIGGSATNDLGLGALETLGLRFLDATGQPIDRIRPSRWGRLATIAGEVRSLPPLRIACDVDNPLLGPSGATFTFGPQKGLSGGDLLRMDEEAGRIGRLLLARFGVGEEALDEPGAGAAGGIGFGLSAACGAHCVSGFSLVAKWLRLEEQVAWADLVVTGEGRFDLTSLRGKGPGAVANAAIQAGKALAVVAGSFEEEATFELQALHPGVHLFPLAQSDLSLEENLGRTDNFLAQALRKLMEVQ